MCLMKMATAGYVIQLLDVEDLIIALDDSGDLPAGCTMESFENLLVEKLMECDPMLLDDLDVVGIEQPILIEIEDDGSWTIVDGHHRLAWAAITNAPVPVVFVTFDIDPIALYNVLSQSDVFYNHS